MSHGQDFEPILYFCSLRSASTLKKICFIEKFASSRKIWNKLLSPRQDRLDTFRKCDFWNNPCFWHVVLLPSFTSSDLLQYLYARDLILSQDQGLIWYQHKIRTRQIPDLTRPRPEQNKTNRRLGPVKDQTNTRPGTNQDQTRTIPKPDQDQM